MTITTQQARQRFTTIPSRLQDAMFSVQTAEIMDGIYQQYHLDDIKSTVIGKITGRVLLGFIHTEDVSKEIQQELNLSSQLAGEISKSLDAKIFNTLQDDLKSAYAPAPNEEERDTKTPIAAPMPVSTIPMPVAPISTAGPKIISESFMATPNVKTSIKPGAVMPVPVTMPVAPAPKPVAPIQPTPQPAPVAAKPNMMEKGWSRQMQNDPVVRLGVITPSVPKPTSAVPGAAMSNGTAASVTGASASPFPKPTGSLVQPNQAMPTKTISEFDRLDSMKKSPTRPTATMPSSPIPTPAKPPGPGPIMLHEVGTPGQGQQAPNFQINTGMQNQISNRPGQSTAMPTRPAVIEFGANATQPPRPPMPPKPPTVTSTPATPPPSASGKVIVQNFLGPQK